MARSSELIHQVLQTIRRYRMLRAGDRVGVGVSGGADSVALLRLLDELRETLGLRLLVLHFNHQLRGAASDADENFVAELATQLGLDFFAGREVVAERARAEGWNLEDAARRLRYEFFERVVREGRADRIAVAHTADDQAETVLAHILRGSGLTGLAGIYPVRGVVVRPLLEVRRQILREYLEHLGQRWREDPSNQDVTRLRARIRHELLPRLEREFHPQVVSHLAGLAERARADEAFWSAWLEERMAALVQQTPLGLRIPVAGLLSPPAGLERAGAAGSDALARRMVRRLVETLKGSRTRLTAQHVEQVLQLTRSQSGGTTHLPDGVVVEREFDHLIFSRVTPRNSRQVRGRGFHPAPVAYEYEVLLPEQGMVAIDIPEMRRRLCLKLIDWATAPGETKQWPGVLDRDLLRRPIRLRNWRPGDAYRPRGRAHTCKVKRLFQEFRIALHERAGWPVLTCEGRLAWVLGMPAAEEFAARPGTRCGVLIMADAVDGMQQPG
ncbi:MAG: tRNA lysidine(34) synthetase TilS [Firmicutes bacterium]|nr:tRNA lysidine(34) synthetase TilS [Bacillota bacterium]